MELLLEDLKTLQDKNVMKPDVLEGAFDGLKKMDQKIKELLNMGIGK